MKEQIIIGTRGSQLALYQAGQVENTMKALFPGLQVKLKIIKTQGDKILDVALSKIGDKGLFTKEIEFELLNGNIDVAVHSLKDLPTLLPKGLKLGAVLERGEFRDAWVSKNGKKLNELKAGDVVATSSLRRISCLLKMNENIIIKDIRGNINSRLKKMNDGFCDAMVMAAAGLQRLGLDSCITEMIDPEIIMPAVSQGTIAIESRINDNETDLFIQKINHTPTWNTIIEERAFLAKLEGGCQVPLGCYSKITGHSLTLNGFVASTDGKEYIKGTVSGPANGDGKLGLQLAGNLLRKGALEILNQIKTTDQTHK